MKPVVFGTLATLAMSLPAFGQVILNRSAATLAETPAPLLRIDRPAAVFSADAAPVITRRQSVLDVSQDVELDGLLTSGGMDQSHMPKPGLFGLGAEWKPLGGVKDKMLYIYGKDPAISRVDITHVNSNPDNPAAFEIGAQFFDQAGDAILQRFTEGQVANSLKVINGSRTPIAVQRHKHRTNQFGVFMLFDRSGSMSDTANAQTDFMRGLLSRVPASSDCAIGYFSTKPTYWSDGAYQSCSALNGHLSDAAFISQNPFGGGTNIYASLTSVFEKMKAASHRQRLLIVITDGDQRSWISKEDVISARPSNTKIVVFRPDTYMSSAMKGIADVEIVLSEEIRSDAQAYNRVLDNFSGAIVEAIDGQIFLRPAEPAS